MGNFWAEEYAGKERFFNLSYPPSVNHLWRHVVINGSVRALLSKEGRKYRGLVRLALDNNPIDFISPFRGRLAVRVIVYPPDKRRRDIDNVCKACLDALGPDRKGEWGAWLDDSQIDILHVERGPVHREGGYVRVHVREIGEGVA